MKLNRRTLSFGAKTSLALLGLASLTAQKAHAQITITSPASVPTGNYAGVFTAQAGQKINFAGTIANNTSDTLYDYQIFYQVGKSANDFSFVGATGTLNFARTTSVINLGSLGISKVTPTGQYVFDLDARGQDGVGDPSDVSSNFYLLNVVGAPTVAPEPSQCAALGVGLLGLGGLLLRARTKRLPA
jgi:hypothetical protein